MNFNVLKIPRIKVLRHFFISNNNVNFFELLFFLFSLPHYIKVRKYIKNFNFVNESVNSIDFNKIKYPLFFPSNYNIISLNQTILETFDKNNWHYYELPQTRVTSEDIVADCGSAEGLFTLSCVERASHVYSIEPLRSFVNCLKLTFKNIDKVTIIDKALSDTNYFCHIVDDGISSYLVEEPNQKSFEIEVTTLDDLFYKTNIDITYIKIDLEGYDLKAIHGAKNLIQKNKPKIAITVYHEPSHLNDIKSFLSNIVPEYNFYSKGIFQTTGSYVMLHAWIK